MIAPLFRRFGVMLAAVALVGAAPQQFAEVSPHEVADRPDAVKLIPTGPWTADFADNKCILQREFDYDGARHVFVIEQYAPSDGFRLFIAGPQLERFNNAKGLAIGLRGDVRMLTGVWMDRASLPGYGPALIASRVVLGKNPIVNTQIGNATQPEDPKRPFTRGQIDPADAAMVDRVVIADAKLREAVSFQTGNLKGALTTLNACTADLLTSWGLDPGQHRAYVAPRMINDLQLTSRLQQNFPRRAALKGENGTFVLRLIVEPDGSISNCHIEAATKVEELDLQCQMIMQTARMAAGTNTEGTPIRSFYTTQVIFSVP